MSSIQLFIHYFAKFEGIRSRQRTLAELFTKKLPKKFLGIFPKHCQTAHSRICDQSKCDWSVKPVFYFFYFTTTQHTTREQQIVRPVALSVQVGRLISLVVEAFWINCVLLYSTDPPPPIFICQHKCATKLRISHRNVWPWWIRSVWMHVESWTGDATSDFIGIPLFITF